MGYMEDLLINGAYPGDGSNITPMIPSGIRPKRLTLKTLKEKIEKQQAQIDGLLAIIELHGKAHGYLQEIINRLATPESFDNAHDNFNSIIDRLKKQKK